MLLLHTSILVVRFHLGRRTLLIYASFATVGMGSMSCFVVALSDDTFFRPAGFVNFCLFFVGCF